MYLQYHLEFILPQETKNIQLHLIDEFPTSFLQEE